MCKIYLKMSFSPLETGDGSLNKKERCGAAEMVQLRNTVFNYNYAKSKPTCKYVASAAEELGENVEWIEGWRQVPLARRIPAHKIQFPSRTSLHVAPVFRIHIHRIRIRIQQKISIRIWIQEGLESGSGS